MKSADQVVRTNAKRYHQWRIYKQTKNSAIVEIASVIVKIKVLNWNLSGKSTSKTKIKVAYILNCVKCTVQMYTYTYLKNTSEWYDRILAIDHFSSKLTINCMGRNKENNKYVKIIINDFLDMCTKYLKPTTCRGIRLSYQTHCIQMNK